MFVKGNSSLHEQQKRKADKIYLNLWHSFSKDKNHLLRKDDWVLGAFRGEHVSMLFSCAFCSEPLFTLEAHLQDRHTEKHSKHREWLNSEAKFVSSCLFLQRILNTQKSLQMQYQLQYVLEKKPRKQKRAK